MPIAIRMHDDFNADDARMVATRCRNADQYRRLLAIAAIYDGRLRRQAARVDDMDRQALCNQVYRLNDEGPDGLTNRRPLGMLPKFDAANKAVPASFVKQGLSPAEHDIVRWRCCDLQTVNFRARMGHKTE